MIWGSDWDELLQRDTTGLLAKRMGEVVDGQYQKYVGMTGSYIREHFFGKYPELLKLVENYSDEQLGSLTRGGHDPDKVYAAYQLAIEQTEMPTVILAQTIKGYGLGTGTIGEPANWAMVIRPGLMTPKGPWGPSTMCPRRRASSPPTNGGRSKPASRSGYGR